MIAAANFTYLIGICMPNIAAWLLRRDLPDAERPYRAPRGTIMLGVVAACIWLLSAVLGFQQFGLPTVVFGLALAYSGAGLYAWRVIEDRRRAGLPALAQTLHVKLTGAMVACSCSTASPIYSRSTPWPTGTTNSCRCSPIFSWSWRC
jgi:amino acid transporter